MCVETLFSNRNIYTCIELCKNKPEFILFSSFYHDPTDTLDILIGFVTTFCTHWLLIGFVITLSSRKKCNLFNMQFLQNLCKRPYILIEQMIGISLALKAPITTAADYKFCDIIPNFRQK